MPQPTNKLSQFWQELKRRKVIKVIAMYAATAFIIMEAGDIMLPRLGLPDWTVTFIIILLIVGFPIAVILSWIFDVTPEGIKKTESGDVNSEEESPPENQRRRLQLSDAIIAVLFITVCILLYPKVFNKDKFKDIRDKDGRISVVVMPFKNMTGDSIYYLWQEGLQNLLITSLSNSNELAVRQYETMFGILGNEANINYASFTSSLAGKVAKKLEASTVILGYMHQFGNNVRITANIMDAGTEEIYKSFVMDGNTEDDFFNLTDSLSMLIRNFLEIKSLRQNLFFDLRNIYTTSSEAYKLYLQGHKCHSRLDYNCAMDFYSKAIEIDSNFVSAMMKLAYCYGDLRQAEMSRFWANKAFDRIDRLPPDIQLLVKEVKAVVEKEPLEMIKHTKQYLETNPHSVRKRYGIGWVYFNTEQYQEAIKAFEKTLEISNRYEIKPWVWTYILLGRAYHYTGNHKEEQRIFDEGRNLWPGGKSQFDFWQAACAISREDHINAQFYLDEIRKTSEQQGLPSGNLLSWYAGAHESAGSLEKAEEYYREVLTLYKDDASLMNDVARFLISNDLDIAKGLALVNKIVEKHPEDGAYLYTYGMALYKSGRLEESLKILKRSWDLASYYDHEHYLLIKRIEEPLASQNQ